MKKKSFPLTNYFNIISQISIYFLSFDLFSQRFQLVSRNNVLFFQWHKQASIQNPLKDKFHIPPDTTIPAFIC